MPDLQSELNKILAANQFDDDKESKPPTVVAVDPKEPAGNNMRERAWHFVKANPGVTVGQIASAIGTNSTIIAGGLHKMVTRGNLTRIRSQDGSGFHYFTSGDSYKVMSHEERMALMQQARVAKATNTQTKPKAKVKKPKAKPIKWVQDKPAEKASPKSFNADEIIAGLTVLQAKELLVKLKEVFGV